MTAYQRWGSSFPLPPLPLYLLPIVSSLSDRRQAVPTCRATMQPRVSECIDGSSLLPASNSGAICVSPRRPPWLPPSVARLSPKSLVLRRCSLPASKRPPAWASRSSASFVKLLASWSRASPPQSAVDAKHVSCRNPLGYAPSVVSPYFPSERTRRLKCLPAASRS